MKGRRSAALALLLVTAGAAFASWRRTDTEHFLIVYEEQDQASADELTALCEDVYARVTAFFRSYPRKVPVVIRGRLDYANGMTAPFPGRLELIVTAPSWPWMGARSESWMRILLTHELVHYVHLGMERGFFDALARVFGGDLRWATAAFLPGWMIEGPTTNLETLFTAGGRGRNPFFESLYKAPTMEGRLFTLEQASYGSAFPPSGRIYVAGYVLVDYLSKTFGEDAFTRIMDEYLRIPFFGPWNAIRTVTGKSAREIYDDMKAGLEQRYRQASTAAGGVRLTPERVGDWQHPVPTARGLYAYRSDLEAYPAVVRVLPDGSDEPIAAIGLTDPSSFTATGDGGTLYAASFFADRRRIDGEEVVSDLSAIDAATGTARRITSGAHLWHPAVSADGERLVAVQGSGPYSRLVEVDPRSGSTRALFSIAGANVYNPAFSPDGTRIALVVNRAGFQDVAVVGYAAALAGARELPDPHAPVEDVNAGLAAPVLGPDAFGEYFPAWNGNDRLLFSSDRSGSLALYEADLATGLVTLVQQDPVAAYEGVVIGDESLVYASYTAEGYCLKRAPLAPARGEAAAVVRAPAEPPTGTVPAPPAASTPYRDRARPFLWYPLVTVGSGYGSIDDAVEAAVADDPSFWDFGVGAVILAGSYLGTSSWTLGAAWHPLTSQPELSFTLSRGLGNAAAGLSHRTGYSGYSGSHVLESATRLGVSVPLVAASAYDRRILLSVAAGATLVSQFFDSVDDATPFTLADVFTDPNIVGVNAALLDAGISFGWGEAGGTLDFVLPRLVSVSLDGSAMLPLLDGGPGARFRLFAQAGLPVFWRHLLVRAGLKASYGIGTLDPTDSPERFAAPRGGFDAEARPNSGRLLGSLDALAPIGLFDRHLLLGVALLGMAAGVHIEAVADWDLDPAAFRVPWLCAGAELTLLFGASSVEIPIGVGLAARFEATGARAFDLATDLRPYVFLSFDSFRDALRAARPEPCPPLD